MKHKITGIDKECIDRLVQDIDFRLGALDAIKARLDYVRNYAVSLDEIEICLALVNELNIGSRFERGVFAEIYARELLIEDTPIEDTPIEDTPTEGGESDDC